MAPETPIRARVRPSLALVVLFTGSLSSWFGDPAGCRSRHEPWNSRSGAGQGNLDGTEVVSLGAHDQLAMPIGREQVEPGIAQQKDTRDDRCRHDLTLLPYPHAVTKRQPSRTTSKPVQRSRQLAAT
jgi:hypothetical protein